jgi:hypothetical protein
MLSWVVFSLEIENSVSERHHAKDCENQKNLCKTRLVELLRIISTEERKGSPYDHIIDRRTESHGSGGLESEANTEPMRTQNSLNSDNQKPRGFREHVDERPKGQRT